MLARRPIALLLAVCAAGALTAAGALASPTRWGQGGGGWNWDALRAQIARRHACGPRAHASHRHRRCAPRPRHGASSTGPAPGGSGAPGASGEGLGSPLPAVPGQPAAPTQSGGAGEEVGPPSIIHVQVLAVEYHFTLSRTTVPAGKVALQFVNDGQDEHNLNVLSGEGEVEAAFPKTLSKGMREQTLTLRNGSFTLFCSLPEHEAKGMHATLTVQ